MELGRRAALVAWGCSLLLLPRLTGAGALVDGVAAAAWLLLLLRTPRAAAVGGACLCAVWVLAPGVYPPLAVLFALAIGWLLALAPPARADARVALAFALPMLLPALVAAGTWFVADDAGRELLRNEWRFPRLTFATLAALGSIQGLVLFAWLLVLERRRESAVDLPVTAIGLAVVLAHGAAIVSLATLPSDADWSESPVLLNLLKLRTGEPVYGPYEACNSYSYAPALELLHRTLLAPLGLDLSLRANRALAIGWQLVTAAILTGVLVPHFPGRRSRIVVGSVMLVAATSSFLAPHLHPDHLLMPWFAAALGLVLHRTRLPERVLLAGLVLVPAAATAVKLTGAGIGLGLAMAFAAPVSRRRYVALALGAAAAIGVLAAYQHAFPRFWLYTFSLQASHPIDWHALSTMPFERPSRLFFVAMVMLAVAYAAGADLRGACRDAGRIVLVTIGFALPSAVAYVKVGGRVNSLLPLTIGGAVVIARLSAEILRARPTARPALYALAMWALLVVTPGLEIVDRSSRELVSATHARAVSAIRREGAEGRRVLFPQSMAAWLDAGRRDVPLDRWQTMSELSLGHHPELRVCLARIGSGEYESIVARDDYFDPRRTSFADDLVRVVNAEYVEVEREEAAAPDLPPLRIFRRRSLAP